MLTELLQSPRQLLTLGLGLTIAGLGVALISQHGFGWLPCELCLMQRYPYYFAVAAGAAALAIGGAALRPLAGLIAIGFALGTALAVVHTGVEFGWWEGFTTCSGGMDLSGSTDDVLARIKGAPVVRCDGREPFLFGLSMTNWNLVVSLDLATCFGLAALGGLRPARAARAA